MEREFMMKDHEGYLKIIIIGFRIFVSKNKNHRG
jgi:hypothetical protein